MAEEREEDQVGKDNSEDKHKVKEEKAAKASLAELIRKKFEGK